MGERLNLPSRVSQGPKRGRQALDLCCHGPMLQQLPPTPHPPPHVLSDGSLWLEWSSLWLEQRLLSKVPGSGSARKELWDTPLFPRDPANLCF